jgi:hypothetical protein
MIISAWPSLTKLAPGQSELRDFRKLLISAWAAVGAGPGSADQLCPVRPRPPRGFLYEYCAQGEPSLFAAVSHIWDSLAEPRDARCIKMGLACGTGGKGKMALVLMLRQFLDRFIEAGGPMPRAGEDDTIHTYHQAAMTHFAKMAAEEAALVEYYAAVLNGAATSVARQSKGSES